MWTGGGENGHTWVTSLWLTTHKGSSSIRFTGSCPGDFKCVRRVLADVQTDACKIKSQIYFGKEGRKSICLDKINRIVQLQNR